MNYVLQVDTMMSEIIIGILYETLAEYNLYHNQVFISLWKVQ